MSNKNDYDVGFGKPPKHTRYKKGTSGNPRGRPRKNASRQRDWALPSVFNQTVLDEAQRKIQVVENDEAEYITKHEAIVRTLIANALKGDAKSADLFMQLVKQAETEQRTEKAELIELALAYKIDAKNAIDDAIARGDAPPEPVPHPDDIIVDPLAGEVRINGPVTQEEHEAWKHLRLVSKIGQEVIADVEAETAEGGPQCKRPDYLHAMVRFADAWCPDEETRRSLGFCLHSWRANHPGITEAPQELLDDWGLDRSVIEGLLNGEK